MGLSLSSGGACTASLNTAEKFGDTLRLLLSTDKNFAVRLCTYHYHYHNSEIQSISNLH